MGASLGLCACAAQFSFFARCDVSWLSHWPSVRCTVQSKLQSLVLVPCAPECRAGFVCSFQRALFELSGQSLLPENRKTKNIEGDFSRTERRRGVQGDVHPRPIWGRKSRRGGLEPHPLTIEAPISCRKTGGGAKTRKALLRESWCDRTCGETFLIQTKYRSAKAISG